MPISNGYPEVEDQEGTRIEKVLLAALVGFLLVGSFWAQDRIESFFPAPTLMPYGKEPYSSNSSEQAGVSVEDELGVTPLRTELEKLSKEQGAKNDSLANALAAKSKADEKYKFRREEYRTAMQAGNASASQRSAFESSRSALESAAARLQQFQAASDEASSKVAAEQQKVNAAAQRAQAVFGARSFQRNVKLVVLHFSFAAACLVLSWILWLKGRNRRWRYQAILTGLFTASILQLFFLLIRYCWELFLSDVATLGVAGIGTAVCIFAIVAIKRWLYSPERLALARLSSRRCALCATPFTETQSHCWKCGHALTEKCPTCGSDRLLYAPFCGTCGAGSVTTLPKSP